MLVREAAATSSSCASVISGEEKHPSGARLATVAQNLERSRWFARVQGENYLPPAHTQRLERLEGFEQLERPISYGTHVMRAPEFASVSCYLSIAVYCPPELLAYRPLCGKTASANALEMTISSWVDPEYPLCQAFRTQSAESMGALGKFEVVLGTLLSM